MSKTAERVETYNQRKHREGNERVCRVMAAKGYQSIFERVHKEIESQTVYTLWVNFSRPFQMMTIVDGQGGVGCYELIPKLGFASASSGDNSDTAADSLSA